MSGRRGASPACALRGLARPLRALAAPVLLLLAACAGLRSPVPDVASMEREILLTVGQSDFSPIGLTGAPDTRYLRRRGYGAPPPEVERVLEQLARDYGIERKEGWPIRSLDVYCEVFVVPEGIEVSALVERLLTDPRVDLAQPMHVFQTLGSTYDDPYADLQPAAAELGVERAHRLATGKGVVVALVDTGVDASHPDLKGRVGIERDLVGSGRGPAHAEVHGTAVAGVIASAINNHEGIIGVAPDVNIASLRACWPDAKAPAAAFCSSFTLARALETAIALRPDVINMSLSGPSDALLDRLLDEVVARGAVVVAAQPEHGEAGAFPSSHPAVIVARSSLEPRPAGFSHGLPAPSEEILTTTPGAGYAFFSGTSLAAAHLTGVVALLLEREPSIDAPALADVLRSTLVQRGNQVSVNACYALEEITDVRVCEPRIETVSRQAASVRSGTTR